MANFNDSEVRVLVEEEDKLVISLAYKGGYRCAAIYREGSHAFTVLHEGNDKLNKVVLDTIVDLGIKTVTMVGIQELPADYPLDVTYQLQSYGA